MPTTTDDDSPGDDITVLAQRARESAMEARDLADRAIDQINALAEKALVQARRVDILIQRLNELQERTK